MRTYPASFAQQRLWFIDQLEPGSSLYNVATVLRLRGQLHVDALRFAVDELVARHETLRTSFAAPADGEPVQIVLQAAPGILEVFDASGASDDRAADARQLAADITERPFDLAAGPLFRARLIRQSPDEHMLALALHHIVSDGWSMSVLYRDLGALYAGFLADRGSLAPLPMQYGEYAVWQREQLSGERLQNELAHWRSQLQGAPPLLELPTDRPRPAHSSYRGGQETVELPPVLTAALNRLSRSEGVTLYMTLLAGFAALLARYSGQPDLIIGSPIAGRVRTEFEQLIGLFVNTLALRVGVGGEPSFRTLLQRVRTVALDAFEHQELPFERLVEALQPKRSLGHAPVVQVLFALQNVPRSQLVLPGVAVETLPNERQTAKFDLVVSGYSREDRLELRADYARDLFNAGTIGRLLHHYRALLEGAVAAPERPVSSFCLIGEAERQAVSQAWAYGPRSPYPAGHSIVSLFEAQVAATPDAVAVESGEEQVTYAELNRRAEHLARRLRRAGVTADTPVGVLIERSAGLIVALVAVLRAGGGYLPLDPRDPPERLRVVLADAGVRVLLADQALETDGTDSSPVVVRLDGDDVFDAAPESGAAISPDHLACVMYTSGSTGTPKGVAVTHRNVIRLVRGADYVRFASDRVFLQLAPVAFDASTFEVWGALLNGARLVIAPPGLLTSEELGIVLRRHQVTTLWLTAGFFRVVVDEDVAVLSGLQELMVGGDVLPVAQVQQVLRAVPRCRLLNGYGPTETTTFATCHHVRDALESTVPIGRPLANVRVYVLDRHLELVPMGVPGELFIGGDGVARGYLGRPRETAERFLPDPFSQAPGQRLYRTGDRVRWRMGGVLEFLGRVDRQLKIRGFRVEPGEVEAVLARHPRVRACAVEVVNDARGERGLVAYVVGGDSESVISELRASLRRQLPEYLVPAKIVRLEHLPLTPSGKLDRGALPHPKDLLAVSNPHFVAPRSATEESVAAVWAEVLGHSEVGALDNFFALGGHSLLATQAVSRIRRALAVNLPVRALFEFPTVAELAAYIESIASEPAVPEPPLVPVGRAAYRIE